MQAFLYDKMHSSAGVKGIDVSRLSPITTDDAQAWLSRQIEQSKAALAAADVMIESWRAPEEKRRPRIVAEVTVDRWNIGNAEAVALIGAALSIQLNEKTIEHIQSAKTWLQNRIREHEAQLARLQDKVAA